MRSRKHDIEKYLRGELSPSEMHALEKEALSDPFLAEALEGIEQAGTDNFLYDLHKLNRSVHDRMRRKSRKNNKTIRMWGWTSAVAATILLVIVSGFLVVQILKDQQLREQGMEATSEDPKNASSDADSPPVNQIDSSLLALQQKDKPAEEVRRPSAVPLQKKDVRDAAREQQKESSQDAVADAGEATKRQEVPAQTESNGGADSKEQAAAEREALALSEIVAEDTSTKAAPAVDRSTGYIEGKVAGVQTKSASETRAPVIIEKTVKGKVTSADGHGLPGVNVVIGGTATGTVTDGEGNYELAVPENAKLVFSFIGFESQEVLAEKTELNVTLADDTATLSEVVVTGYGVEENSRDAASFRFAEPDGGRIDFKSYLANAVKYPQEAIRNKIQGRVTVRFTVEPNGKLTDFEVEKGIGSGCEEELIRAIQQGPYWKPSARGEQPVKDKVRVRFKFNLPK
jgi:TonB family protein